MSHRPADYDDGHAGSTSLDEKWSKEAKDCTHENQGDEDPRHDQPFFLEHVLATEPEGF
jgi:hypothetical protein